jgi:DNA mismatch endonuclease (patch repair protein)
MADVFTRSKRSEVMSKIRSKDTGIETQVRKWLYSKGFRYRKNYPGLPGHPDIVLHKYKTVIFVHGCFWHHHKNCRYAYVPKTRTEFWMNKINGNVERDKRTIEQLREMDWNVIVVWECELKKNPITRLESLSEQILDNDK